MFQGTKANSRKEVCYDEFYLGLPVYRFYIHCKSCYAEITIRTDPANADYTIEASATRHFEPWRELQREQIDKAKSRAGGSQILELVSHSINLERAAKQDRAVERSVYGEKKRHRRPAARDVARIHEEDHATQNLSWDDRERVATFEVRRDQKPTEKVSTVRRFQANRWTRTLLSYADQSDN
jgi:hypothetical protein